MPFIKANIQNEIAEEIKKDTEFEYLFNISELEYQFVKKIKELRDKEGITQNELSKKANVTQQMISRVEQLNKTPTLTTIIKILSSMGYELEIKKMSIK